MGEGLDPGGRIELVRLFPEVDFYILGPRVEAEMSEIPQGVGERLLTGADEN